MSHSHPPRPLPSARQLKDDHPLPSKSQDFVAQVRSELRQALDHRAQRLVVVVGPCSIHSEAAARLYADALLRLREKVQDQLCLVMRAYFEKPRTTTGWKGFLYDPGINGESHLDQGLARARALLVELTDLGLPLATELLDPLTAPYLEDCLSWVAIGARTTESQLHRQAASGLDCPVGFKNGTDGGVEVAADAICASQSAHTHLGINEEAQLSVLRTQGNAYGHVVLRGGQSGPNYDAVSVGRVSQRLRERKVREALMVDCSHGNSNKDYRRQSLVARAVLEQLHRPDAHIFGLMLESHLEAGAQKASPDAGPKQSITDACISMEETEQLLLELAEAHSGRSQKRAG